MNVEVKIDEKCLEPRIIVVTNRVTDEVNEIVKRLSGGWSQVIAGFKDGQVSVLEPGQIYRVFASCGKVYAETKSDIYSIKQRLYEAEERLCSQSFVRISNGEIINLKKVKGFDLSLAGTIRVSLLNGTSTYVSRRYVSKIKQLLGI